MFKRILYLLICCIALQIPVHAQTTIAKYKYWFDNNVGSAQTINTGSVSVLEINEEIATSQLSNGLHTFSIQFYDNNNKASVVTSEFFTKSPTTSPASPTIVAYEYWFDNNYVQKQLKPLTPGNSIDILDSITTSQLTDGLHTFSMRFIDSQNQYSQATSQFFIKTPHIITSTVTIVSYEYWFDNNYTQKQIQAVSSGSTFLLLDSINTSQLTDGLHTINVRFKSSNNYYSSVTSKIFTKLPVKIPISNSIDFCEYWFDTNYANKQSKPLTANQTISFLDSIQTASLANGLHTFSIRFRDTNGKWTPTQSSFFTKNNSNINTSLITAYEYWFDTEVNRFSKTLSTPSTIFSILDSIQTSQLPFGLHTVTIRIKDNTGTWSSPISSFFTKTSQEITQDQTIIGYEYWFNNTVLNATYTPISAGKTVDVLTDINTSSLPNGFHTITIRFKHSNNAWSSPTSKFFQKQEATIVSPIITQYRYWFDDESPQKIFSTNNKTSLVDIDTIVSLIHIPKGKHVIHVQVGDSKGNWSVPVSDSITKLSFPIASFSIDTIWGCDSVMVAFTNTSIDGDNYTWLFGDGSTSEELNPTHAYNKAGAYSISLLALDTIAFLDSTITKANSVNIYASPKVSFIAPKTNICEGDSISVSIDNEFVTPLWSTTETNKTIFAKDSGMYVVQITDTNTCAGIDSIYLTKAAKPIVLLGADTSICKGNNVLIDAQNAGNTFTWNTGDNTQTISADTTGIYVVEVTNEHLCSSFDTLELTVNNIPEVNLGKDTSICKGESIVLNAQNTGNTFTWNTGKTTQTISTDTTGTYVVEVTNGHLCSSSDTLQLTVRNLPEIELGADKEVYTNDEVFVSGPDNMVTYNWSTNENSKEIEINTQTPKDTLISLEITDEYGCKNSDTISIVIILVNNISSVNSITYELYPNPSNGIFNIQTSSENNIQSVNVYNAIGQLVFAKNTIESAHTSINVSHLPSGIYKVHIKGTHATSIATIVIK